MSGHDGSMAEPARHRPEQTKPVGAEDFMKLNFPSFLPQKSLKECHSGSISHLEMVVCGGAGKVQEM